MLRRIFKITTTIGLALTCSTAFCVDTPTPSLDATGNLMKRARDMAKSVKIEVNPYADQGKAAAEETYRVFQSSEYQEKLRAETERIRSGIFPTAMSDYYKDGGIPGAKPGGLPSDERIYVFVSASVPAVTLRNYAATIARLNDPNVAMVMRGMVGGMKYIQPTIDFAGEILRRNQSCKGADCEVLPVNFMIDPLLFRKYGITHVPAIVFAQGVTVSDAGKSEGMKANASSSDYFTIYGDTSLEYALQYIHRETKIPSLKTCLKKIRSEIQ